MKSVDYIQRAPARKDGQEEMWVSTKTIGSFSSRRINLGKKVMRRDGDAVLPRTDLNVPALLFKNVCQDVWTPFLIECRTHCETVANSNCSYLVSFKTWVFSTFSDVGV